VGRKGRSQNIVLNDKGIRKNQKFYKNPSFEKSVELDLWNPSKSYLEELQDSLLIVLPWIEAIVRYSRNVGFLLYKKVFDKNGCLKKM